MQNRGLIIILTVTLVLVTIYELSFTAVTYRVKRDAKEYAKGSLVLESQYLDSIALLSKDQWSYLGNNFKECQKKEINLGLDLKGGMNVIMEVAVDDILRALSDYNPDKTFNQALAKAKDRRKISQADFIDLFQKAFEELDPNAKLASIFGTIGLKGKINFNSTNDEVIKVLKTETDAAIDNAFNVLSTRIDRFGVVQPNITKGQTKGRILIELPGVKDPKRVRELLQGSANLEFWETYENGEILGGLSQINTMLREMQVNVQKSADSLKKATSGKKNANLSDTTKKEQSLMDIINKDTTAKSAENQSLAQFTVQNPLFGVLRPMVDRQGQPTGGSLVGLASFKDTATVNRYLRMNQSRTILPRDVRFAWSQKPYEYDKTKSMYELHALKVTTRDGRAPLDGSVVTSARPSSGVVTSDIKVDMSMNAEGAKTWARLTRENIGRSIAIVLDGYVRSFPRVSVEITGGNSEILGHFTLEEAQDLSNILMSGKLPAPARIVSDTVVGPSLGKEAIQAGFTSFAIAFLLILAYMIFYYNKAGLVADLALFTNIVFLFGVLASLGAVLTLPGIAGIVLTTGMAVDANVIIYERIREELRAGKSEKLAIHDGFHHALSAIIDSHVTSILTGIVLYTFGTGPIRGFATTLVIGNLLSLFTAFFLSRLMFDWLIRRKSKITFSIPMTEHILKNTHIDFIGMRKIFYGLSLTVTIIGAVSLLTRGLNPGIDFAGGRTYVIKFDHVVKTEDIASSLTAPFHDLPMVVTFGGDNQVKITTKYKINESGVDNEIDSLLYNGLKPYLGSTVTKDKFLTDNRKSSENVGPTIATDTKIKAVWAVAIALVMMFSYIFLRFKTWQHGFGAVVALFHDSLIIISIYSLGYGFLPFSMDIDQSFIAAILTVIGYSVMDTVIVFDRLREYIPLYPKRDRKEVMNMALNSTLSRTINTSMTVILVLLAIFFFGGAVIRGFVFAMLVGVVVGTYSSVFVATSLVYDTTRKEAKKAISPSNI
ncbi:MAG TPA: protein translocase subunit SecDF [Bacteroidales bacterium]|nr:protein translocase subunit SecDF [Bacteroidales bacterium]